LFVEIFQLCRIRSLQFIKRCSLWLCDLLKQIKAGCEIEQLSSEKLSQTYRPERGVVFCFDLIILSALQKPHTFYECICEWAISEHHLLRLSYVVTILFAFASLGLELVDKINPAAISKASSESVDQVR
jgi:hypothetical protein